MSDTNNAIRAYLRQGVNAGDDAEARFEFEGVPCALRFQEDGTIFLHKVKADGALAKAKVGTGKWHVEEIQAESKSPTLIGLFGTAKGSIFEIAGWMQDDEGDRYYSLNIRPRLVRNGFLPG